MASNIDLQEALRRLEMALDAEVMVSLETDRLEMPVLGHLNRVAYKTGQMWLKLEIRHSWGSVGQVTDLSFPIRDAGEALSILVAIRAHVRAGFDLWLFRWNGSQINPLMVAGGRKRWLGYA